ncbi:MAG: thrombospondin type 3 repeat-containing protein [Oligoflexia bacterium]|nr:thrombospondin type 3 repeat-containing protein [Oligoflexia bacterium]
MGTFNEASAKTRRLRGIFHNAATIALVLATQSCSKTNALTGLNRLQMIQASPEGVTVNFCTDPAVQQQNVVKMLVILDHSGSNHINYQMDPSGSGAPYVSNPVTDSNGALIGGSLNVGTAFATDPTGLFRYGSQNTTGTLLNYLYSLPATDPLHYFALIDFNSGISNTIPAVPGGSPAGTAPLFTNNIDSFRTSVTADLGGVNAASTSDTGATNYDLALQTAANAIQADISAAAACAGMATTAAPTASCPNPGVQVASSYVIVFASDGSPIMDIFGVDPTTYTINPATTGRAYSVQRQSNELIISDVQSIMAKASGDNARYVTGINLFTVYYYNPTNALDDTGLNLLQQMAKAGNGLFYKASSTGTSLDFSQFLPLSKTIKYTLADVFVTNSSVVYWSDGALHADTDMDGLPDDVELAFGSDPNSRDTWGYGVADSVEYAVAQQNNLAPCSKNANGICKTPPPNYATTGGAVCTKNNILKVNGAWHQSDPDGLNDCEKLLLSDTVTDVPDSNNDMIPDWLEFINGVPFQLGSPSASTVTSTDGISAYQKIKESLPANYPMNQILNATPTVYTLTQLSTSSVQDCYNLVVTGLPVIGNQNTVRVDLIETSELIPGSIIYHVGKKQFPAGSQIIEFSDWNNAAEQTAGTWKAWETP